MDPDQTTVQPSYLYRPARSPHPGRGCDVLATFTPSLAFAIIRLSFCDAPAGRSVAQVVRVTNEEKSIDERPITI